MKTTPERMERRSTSATGALRATKGKGGGPKIGGLAIPVGQWSEDLGGFVEQILPGAFKVSIETDDIRSLSNHNSDHVLGRVSAGTLRLTEDDRGISYEVDAPDTTWARDLAESIRRGDIRENSFGMFVTDDLWEERDGMMRRSVRVAQLMELGPQPFPAYPQSDVSVRSLADTLAHGRACVGRACKRGGQDPEVLERELNLSRRGLKRSCGSYSDVMELGRELDSRQPITAHRVARQTTRAYPRLSIYRGLLGNGHTRQKVREIAYHEAGHSLIAFLDGCQLGEVRLEWQREGGSWRFTGGKCTIQSGPHTSLMYVAGQVAMELAGLGPMNRTSWSTGDDERALKCTKQGVMQDRQRARATLKRHWPAVRALALRLMEVQRIDGPEAEQIILANLDANTRSRLRAAA